MATIDPNTLVAFWNQDCFSQSDFIDRLKQYMRDSIAYVKENTTSVVRLNQSTEPTQFEWEQAWLVQTGKTLPISPNGSLIWFNTATNEFGGEYGTTENLSTVYRREPLYPKGAIVYYNSASMITSQTSQRTGIASNKAIFPSLTFSIRQVCDVFLNFHAYLDGSAGGVGVDFELNGNRVSTTYFTGLGSANSMMAFGSAGVTYQRAINVTAPIYNLPAGTYLVQSLLGFITNPASGASFDVGGATRGARILTVKAIAK